MKKPKIPQKLEEQLHDLLENVQMYAEQVSGIYYSKGYLDGALKVYKLIKNGADFDDITGEIEELKNDLT